MDFITRTTLWVSILLAILYILISSQLMFSISNYIFRFIGLATYKSDGPTLFGQIFHAFIFSAVIYLVVIVFYRWMFRPDANSVSEIKKRNGGRVPID